MRTKLSIINSIAGVFYRISFLLLQFVVRYFFVRSLASELLGLESLYSNVLGVLSLIDLGLTTAISFSLYKPLYNKDRQLLSSIMHLYKRVYLGLGIIIFICCLMIMPFIQFFLKDNTINIDYIRISFLIYAMGTVVTYFFSHKRTLLFASQRNYIISITDATVRIITTILQIITMFIFHNYLMYLSLIILNNLVANIIISKKCDKLQLYDSSSECQPLSGAYKKDLLQKIKDLSITNLCGKGVNSTDSILVSSLVSTSSLASFSNYNLVILAVQSIVKYFLDGIAASVGDLIAENDKVKMLYYFKLNNFMCYLIASFCSLCFFFLIHPFITLWVGKSFLFSIPLEFILMLELYIILIQQIIWTYQNLGGLYSIYKKYSIVQLIINLAVSIILSQIIGISGIFIGTAVCYLYGWISFSICLHSNLFQVKSKNYWKNELFRFFIFIMMFATVFIVSDFISLQNLYLELFKNLLIIIIIYSVFIFMFFRNNKYLKALIEKLTIILRRSTV